MTSDNPTLIFAKKIALVISKELEIDSKLFKLYQSTSSKGRIRLEIKTHKSHGYEIKYNGFSLDIRNNRGTLGYTDQWQEIPLNDEK